jgi:hypothetical protein
VNLPTYDVLRYNSREIHIQLMDLTSLSIRVQASRLLTEGEKMYWLQHIPRMNAEQLTKLERVLGEAEKLHWSENIPNFAAAKTLIPEPA